MNKGIVLWEKLGRTGSEELVESLKRYRQAAVSLTILAGEISPSTSEYKELRESPPFAERIDECLATLQDVFSELLIIALDMGFEVVKDGLSEEDIPKIRADWAQFVLNLVANDQITIQTVKEIFTQRLVGMITKTSENRS